MWISKKKKKRNIAIGPFNINLVVFFFFTSNSHGVTGSHCSCRLETLSLEECCSLYFNYEKFYFVNILHQNMKSLEKIVCI